jgi:hypothetical protein
MARKDSDSPAKEKKPSRISQLKQVFTLTRRFDPLIWLWMLLAFAGIVLLGHLIGARFDQAWYGTFVATPLGLLAATFVLSRRAEGAMYSAFEGQTGGAGASLQALRRGWAYDQQPVAIDSGRSTNVNDAALVYRAVGRAGVVLIAEGPAGRAAKLLAQERRKTQRLAPGVPVTAYRVGAGGGDDVVTHRELVSRMQKLAKHLTKAEVTAVNKRLKSLGGARPPVPPGLDPQRARSMGRGPRV